MHQDWREIAGLLSGEDPDRALRRSTLERLRELLMDVEEEIDDLDSKADAEWLRCRELIALPLRKGFDWMWNFVTDCLAAESRLRDLKEWKEGR